MLFLYLTTFLFQLWLFQTSLHCNLLFYLLQILIESTCDILAIHYFFIVHQFLVSQHRFNKIIANLLVDLIFIIFINFFSLFIWFFNYFSFILSLFFSLFVWSFNYFSFILSLFLLFSIFVYFLLFLFLNFFIFLNCYYYSCFLQVNLSEHPKCLLGYLKRIDEKFDN